MTPAEISHEWMIQRACSLNLILRFPLGAAHEIFGSKD